MSGQTLLEEVETLSRSIAALAARDAKAAASGVIRAGDTAAVDGLDAVKESLAQILSRTLPVVVRRRLERLRKRLDSRDPATPRGDLAREMAELVEPFHRVGWAEDLVSASLEALPGVGTKRAEGFARRGLERVSDLLFWLPTRYEDRRKLSSVGDLVVGQSATFLAEVKLVDWVTTRRGGRFGKIFQAVVGDDEAVVMLKWFRGGDALASQVVKGRWLLVTGEVKRYRFSKELLHPEVEVVSDPNDSDERVRQPKKGVDDHARVVPVYSAPDGMNPRTFRRLVGQSVDAYADFVVGHLPAHLISERHLPDVAESLRALHRPAADIDIAAYERFASPAHERLVLEELYLLELGLAMRRKQAGERPGIAIDASRPESRSAAKALPYRLTQAQRRVVGEILADLARPHPMNRLIQGDVGSGKTVVAVLAAVAVAVCRGQSALMAPTELLAEQHYRTLRALVDAAGDQMPLRVGLLTASLPRAEIKAVRGLLAMGELDLVVGTHALVQGEVEFRNLVLSIVDEQHRFGVLQRAALAAARPDGRFPHRLVMTATPIPRTLAMTLYGELDLSILDELPPGRKPIDTLLLREGEGQRVMDLIRENLARDEQVYVVYPLVEESEKMDLRSAIESAEQITRAFPEHRVDLVHGQLDAESRHEAMRRFETGETAILVATTVIEVGVDVPNATLMVIEHAERFGLSQLHQLRGRVGRGDAGGRCVLVARGSGEKSEMRLRAMTSTQDGFRIADADLEIRGPGDFLGTRQSGHLPELRIADLLRDSLWVAVARQAARAAIDADPDLVEAPATRRAVRKRWGKRIDLAGVG